MFAGSCKHPISERHIVQRQSSFRSNFPHSSSRVPAHRFSALSISRFILCRQSSLLFNYPSSPSDILRSPIPFANLVWF